MTWVRLGWVIQMRDHMMHLECKSKTFLYNKTYVHIILLGIYYKNLLQHLCTRISNNNRTSLFFGFFENRFPGDLYAEPSRRWLLQWW